MELPPNSQYYQGPPINKGTLGLMGVIGLSIFLLTASVYLTEEPGYLNLVRTVVPLLGAAFSMMCGMELAGAASRHVAARNSGKPYHSTPISLSIGLFLVAASILGGFLTLIPGLLLVLNGLRRQGKLRQGTTPLGNGGKYFLIGLSFVAGFLPAAIVSLIMWVIVDLRYCEVTNPKCM